MWARVGDWIRVKRGARAVARAEEHRRCGRLSAARREYEHAMSLVPAAERSEPARDLRAHAHLGLGRVFLAANAADRAVRELDLAHRLAAERWQPLYWKGCALAWKRHYDAAERDFSRALELCPSEGRLYVQRGFARLKSGKTDAALGDLSTADERGALDGNADGLTVLADLRARRGELQEAERLARRVLDDYPDHRPATLLLGRVLEGERRWAQAIAVYERLRRLGGAEAEACERLGAVHDRLGNDAAALESFDRAMSLGRDGAALLFHRGRVCLRQGAYAECVRSWTELVRRNVRHAQLARWLSQAKCEWAETLLGEGRAREAADLLDDCPSEAAAEARLSRRLAELCLAVSVSLGAGDPVARRQFRRARELAPGDIGVLVQSARLERLAGERPSALRILMTALRTAPDDAGARFCLGVCAFELGDAAKAEGEFRLAERSGATPWARRAGRALVALYVAAGRWADAARVLAEPAVGGPAGLQAQCLFRAGSRRQLERLSDGAPETRFWQVLGLAAERRLGEAVGTLRELARRPLETSDRAGAVAALLRRIALDHAGRGEWEEGARLLVDAAGTAEGQPLTSDGRLEGLVLLLAGRRHAAIQALTTALRRQPGDGALAHTLGVAAYFTARAGAGGAGSRNVTGEPDLRDYVMGAWVMVWSNEAFHERWRLRSSQRYGREVTAADMSSVSRRLTASIEQWVTREQAGEGGTILERELRGADLIRRFNGLPVRTEGHARVILGPLMVGLLGLTSELGALVSRWRARAARTEHARSHPGPMAPAAGESAGNVVDAGEVRRLARYFSQLGLAQVLLDLDRADEAIQALTRAACARCRARASTGGRLRSSGVSVCDGDCPKFRALNPAYADATPHGHLLREDALALAIEVRIHQAERSLTTRDGDIAQVVDHWREALRLADVLGRRDPIEARVVETTFARVRRLERTNRLDAAIALMEPTEELCRGEARAMLVGRRGQLLTVRGIIAGNEQRPRWTAAVTDLRAAVACNPMAARPAINLGIGLRQWAGERFTAGEPLRAVKLLGESVQVLAAAARRMPGHDRVAAEGEASRGALRTAVECSALQLATEHRYDDALAVLAAGLTVLDHPDLRVLRRRIFAGYSMHLANAGQLARAASVLDRGLAEFPGDPTMLQNLVAVRRALAESRRR